MVSLKLLIPEEFLTKNHTLKNSNFLDGGGGGGGSDIKWNSPF
jgi:hypothetical protein